MRLLLARKCGEGGEICPFGKVKGKLYARNEIHRGKSLIVRS